MKNERHYTVNDKGQRMINKFFIDVQGKDRQYFLNYSDQMDAVNFWTIKKGLDCSYGQEYEIVEPENKLTNHQQKVFKRIVESEQGYQTQEPFFNPTQEAIIRKGFLRISEPFTKRGTNMINLIPC